MQKRKPYKNHTRLQMVICAILNATFLLTSCASKGSVESAWDVEIAFRRYDALLDQLRETEAQKPKEFSASIADWLTLSDSIFTLCMDDSTQQAHNPYPSRFCRTADSIRTELTRIASNSNYTLKDVVQIKYATSLHIYKACKVVPDTADAAFFKRMDEEIPYRYDKAELLYRYSSFLDGCLRHGIHSDERLNDFLQAEDRLFRTFLLHIHEWKDVSVKEITEKTQSLCDSISHSVTKGELSRTRTLVRMTMRSNRRLLQNADFCLQSYARGDKLSDEQLHAYQYMILQPYYTIDNFAMSILDVQQVKALQDMADRIQSLSKKGRLFEEASGLANLPTLLIKIFLIKL